MRRAVITTVLIVVGTALSVQPASATVSVGHTNLTIHVKGSSVSGKLVGKPECRPNQPIELWVDGALQTTTTTDGSGNYSLTGVFSSGSTVQTRFQGTQTGFHPNVNMCTPALSRVVVIKDHGNSANAASLRIVRSPAQIALAATHGVLARLSFALTF